MYVTLFTNLFLHSDNRMCKHFGWPQGFSNFKPFCRDALKHFKITNTISILLVPNVFDLLPLSDQRNLLKPGNPFTLDFLKQIFKSFHGYGKGQQYKILPFVVIF